MPAHSGYSSHSVLLQLEIFSPRTDSVCRLTVAIPRVVFCYNSRSLARRVAQCSHSLRLFLAWCFATLDIFCPKTGTVFPLTEVIPCVVFRYTRNLLPKDWHSVPAHCGYSSHGVLLQLEIFSPKTGTVFPLTEVIPRIGE